jgi:hypothetical protein
MQEVSKEDVVDSRFDRTVYRLGPKIVEGSVGFPAIFGDATSSVTETLYNLAVRRNSLDGHLGLTTIDVKYTANNATFRYGNNLVDQFTFAVAQQEIVNITVAVIGSARSDQTFQPPAGIDNRRVVTWNDAVVEIFGTIDVKGEFIRSFEVTIANNAERFYTLNGALAPQDIAPTKRDVTGNLALMGRHPQLAELALGNEDRCTETNAIKFGYVASADCGGNFCRQLPNCVFEIEEIALTNDLFESTVNYHSLPAASTSDDPLDSPCTF